MHLRWVGFFRWSARGPHQQCSVNGYLHGHCQSGQTAPATSYLVVILKPFLLILEQGEPLSKPIWDLIFSVVCSRKVCSQCWYCDGAWPLEAGLLRIFWYVKRFLFLSFDALQIEIGSGRYNFQIGGENPAHDLCISVAENGEIMLKHFPSMHSWKATALATKRGAPFLHVTVGEEGRSLLELMFEGYFVLHVCLATRMFSRRIFPPRVAFLRLLIFALACAYFLSIAVSNICSIHAIN